jgi:hypothetical protein
MTTKILLSIFSISFLFFACKGDYIDGKAMPIKQPISGKITCEINTLKGIPNVKVELIRMGLIIESTTTDFAGEYKLSQAVEDVEYDIVLTQDPVVQTAFTTLDLMQSTTAIEKANNGLVVYTDFQKLALDADLNGNLDNNDGKAIRDLVLGVANTTKIWRFVTKDYTFPSAKNTSVSGIKIKVKNAPESINFIMVRLGDIFSKKSCG